MSGYSQVKGITVKINGDSTGLQKAINDVKKQTAGLDTTMSKLKSSMKLNPGDYQSFATYQDLLKDKINSTTKQLGLYNQALAKFPKTETQWAKSVGNIKSELTTYQSALKSTSYQLAQLKEQQSSKVSFWSTELSNAQMKYTSFSRALKDNQTAISQWGEALTNGLRPVSVCENNIESLITKQASLRTNLNSVSKELSNAQSKLTYWSGGNNQLAKQIQATSKRHAELTSEIERLEGNIGEIGVTSEEWRQKLNALKAAQATCKNQLVGLQNQFISTNSVVLRTVDGLNKASTAASKFAKAIAPISALSAGLLVGATAEAISFESAWTGVTKTVEGTPTQLKKVNDGLKELATNTASSYQDIASYAEIAGQMGVETENVVEFTKVITQLGDTTNLVGEEAAQALAKFANIMQGAGAKSNEYYSRLGSTIVDLGNKFATTEADISAMSNRLAVGAKQVGINEQGVLALSTALSSLGIKAEAGGSAVSKVLKTIDSAVTSGGESLEKYAKVAGMSAEQFASAWKNNALDTFVKVLQGIGNSADGVNATLNDLGITAIRQSQAIGALAQSSDVLTKAISVSNSAWSENSAMTTEAEKRYATLKSQLSQTWEAIKQAGNELGQALTPTLTSLAKSVKNIALAFANLDDGTQETIAKMLLLTAAAWPVSKAFSKITSVASKGIVGLVKMRSSLMGVTSALSNAGIIAENSAPSFLGIATGFAKSHPYILLATAALGGFAAACANATKKHKEALATANEEVSTRSAQYKATLQIIDAYDEYATSMNKVNKKISNITASYDKNVNASKTLMNTITELNAKESLNSVEKSLMAQAVEELNALYPDLNVQIDENTGKLNLNEGANYNSIESIQQRINALQEEAKQEALTEIATKNATAQLKAQMESADLSSSIASTVQEFKNLNTEYLNGKMSAQEWQTQTEAVRDSLFTLCSDLGDSYTKLHETQANAILQSNYLETNSMTQMGETMKASFADLVAQSTNAGIEIPTKLTEGITNGTATAVEASKLMASMMSLNSLVDEAGMVGGSIPMGVANGILANCTSISDATTAMNNLITFAQAIQSAGLEGVEIPEGVAEGVASNDIAVSEAIGQMMQKAMPELDEAAEKMVQESTNTANDIGTAFSSNTSAATGVGTMGSNMQQALSTYLSNMTADAKTARDNILAYIQSAQDKASQGITITKTVVTKKGGKNTAQESLSMQAVALADTLADTQPLALPNTVDTAYISTRTITDSATRSNARVDALSSKLDSFINAFMSANLTINLQPMELDGGAITDVVQETISIRDMLSSWGKGGS